MDISSDAITKIINFSFDNDTFRYKFAIGEPIEDIDLMIRQRFNIPSNHIYFLVDKSDSTIISLRTLTFLPNETNVSIQLQNSNLNSTSSTNMLKSVDRDTLSFSDNKSKLKASDLSSTSTSESENENKSNIHYHSLVAPTGVMKINAAADRKRRNEFNIICSRKINHFLQKYGNIKDIDCKHVSHDIMKNLNIPKTELYNLLKFIRNTMNVLSLNINKENIIHVIGNIYKNNYLHA